ncbi:MAG: M16 family metallopeptidase [Vampirovibrionia bacterium]
MLKVTRLDNGLKIITEYIPDVRSATISLLVSVGSAVETPEIAGISHFVEHLIFKGTETRTAQEIAQSVEDYGGALNAFTEKELTYYYARVLTEQVESTVDIFCDMILNSIMDPKEIELERQVILEEIKMYEDTPDELVYDIMFRSVWGDCSIAQSVTGSYDTVNKLSRDDILKFIENFYTPDNIIISLAGNFDVDRVIDLIKRSFDSCKKSKLITKVEIPSLSQAKTAQSKEIEQAHLCLSTMGMPLTSDDRYALAAIDIALAGGISSRLFQEVREKRGLAYSINSYKALYKPAGIFGVYAATSVKNIQEILDIVLDEFSSIRDKGLTDDELARAKKQLTGSLLLGLESTYYRAYRNIHSELYFDKIYSIDEICALIQAISMDDVNKVADYIFDPSYYGLTIVGPKGISADYSLNS